MIESVCPGCRKIYKFKDTALSKNFVCDCGRQFIIEPELNIEEEVVESPKVKKEVVYLKGEAAKAGVNLTDRKVCSKCKAIIPIASVKCPQCDYNTLNVKYDKQKRDEMSFHGISIVIKYGKYILPVVVVLIFLGMVIFQNGKIDETKELIRLIDQKVELERLKGNSRYKILRAYPSNKNRYITADSMKKSFDIFALGSGLFSLKTPGIKMIFEYTNKPGTDKRYYIWNDDKTDAIEAIEREYVIKEYEPIAIWLRD